MSPGDTRERILETAARLFHEQGYHATGIATILREAEVNSGSLYHFFPSKEDLLNAVLERYLDILRPAVMDHVENATSDPIERVWALFGMYRMGLEAMGCARGCPIGNLALEVGDAYPKARALIDRNLRQWSSVVQGWLDDAGERLPPDVDRSELADFILTVMEGAILQARAAGSLTPFDRSVSQLRGYFGRLVRPEAPTRKPSQVADPRVG